MDFGEAVRALKQGRHVARAGWNGKGMHLYLEDSLAVQVRAGAFKGTVRKYEPVIVMFTAQGKHQPGWHPSTPDVLAEDWEVVNG